MKHIIHKSTALLCLLVLVTGLFAAPEAEYGKVSKSWKLNADDSQEYRYSMELTLFTHTAMNSTYGESFILYNPEFQEVKIHSSYTKQKDGTIIETPGNAFVEVLPRFATDAAAYNQLKELVVVHTGLELGATIYLDYSIFTKPSYYPALDIDEFLQETSPVNVYEASVSFPDSKPFTCGLYGASVKGTDLTHKNGLREKRWVLRNVPASSRESFQAANKNGVPRLVGSSLVNKDALAVLEKRFKAADAMESETYARFITEDAGPDEEKIKKIRQYVVNGLGTSAVPLEHTGYTVRNGEDMVRSAYGTIAEKTQLLNSMLNAAGISSSVVVIYPGTVEVNTCGLKAIKGMAVQVTVDGKEQFLSAVSLAPSTIPLRGALDKVYTLDGNELHIEASLVVINEKIELSLSADQVKDGFIVCELPEPSSGIGTWQVSTLNSKRSQLFEIPSLLKEEVVYTITPEPGMQLKSKATTQTITRPFGKFTQTVAEKEGSVEVVRTIELTKTQFTPSEYAGLRALILAWVNPANRTLLFAASGS